jgi:hypothetical protein
MRSNRYGAEAFVMSSPYRTEACSSLLRQRKATRLACAALLLRLGCTALVAAASVARAAELHCEVIQVARGKHFVLSSSKTEFHPWGFNYDHDAANRLLEDYWQAEWEAVTNDFREMKALGANTVRIHLQVAKFMRTAQDSNEDSLRQLGRLLEVAEEAGLYLDITGLGCYKKEDVPRWYNDLDEAPRREVQARFWEAVARCAAKALLSSATTS